MDTPTSPTPESRHDYATQADPEIERRWNTIVRALRKMIFAGGLAMFAYKLGHAVAPLHDTDHVLMAVGLAAAALAVPFPSDGAYKVDARRS